VLVEIETELNPHSFKSGTMSRPCTKFPKPAQQCCLLDLGLHPATPLVQLPFVFSLRGRFECFAFRHRAVSNNVDKRRVGSPRPANTKDSYDAVFKASSTAMSISLAVGSYESGKGEKEFMPNPAPRDSYNDVVFETLVSAMYNDFRTT
jgi:hypothetical protein